VGNRMLLVSHSTDAAVHPKYQGRGIYTKMAELKKVEYNKDGPNLSYWIADNPIFIKSGLRKGRPTLPHPLINMLRIRDVKLHLSKTKSTK
jgi:hypothetical protein